MPRIDSPDSKLKAGKVKPFKKESLRPWDNIESITNRYQSDNDNDNNPVMNRKQIDNEPITKSTVIDNKPIINREHSGNVIDNDSITNFHFNKLSRLQQNILFFIANECKKTGGFETKVVYRSSIAAAVSAGENTVKTITRRLEKKGAVMTVESKAGKEGWSRYKIPEPIFKEILRNELSAVIDNKSVTLSITNQTYSSSNNNIKTTTTDEWAKIDCEPLASIGFRAVHLKQLKDKINPELVTESIEHFAWGLQNKGIASTCTSKLGAFISALKRGTPWTEPALLDQDNLVIQAMLEAKQRKEKEREGQMEQLFVDWDSALTDEQKHSYESGKFTNEAARRAERKEHFIKNVLKK